MAFLDADNVTWAKRETAKRHVRNISNPKNTKINLSGRDAVRASGVDKSLVRVISNTISNNPLPKGYTIRVNEGLRTRARQRQLVASGASQTMNSRHLTGDALDIAIFKPDGSYSKDFADYQKVSVVAKKFATAQGVNMTWGGDWKTLRDGPHFQVNKRGNAKYLAKQSGKFGKEVIKEAGTSFGKQIFNQQQTAGLLKAFLGTGQDSSNFDILKQESLGLHEMTVNQNETALSDDEGNLVNLTKLLEQTGVNFDEPETLETEEDNVG